MKVGTDGVLLGAWANVEQSARILDVGTGSGLLALMLAQRQHRAAIDAIEIEENAYRQACENVLKSPWSNRIRVFHTSLQEFAPAEQYDLIVSNPPFFSQSLHNPNVQKRTARHNDSLLPAELIHHARRLLASNGKLAVIYPLHEAQLFCKVAQESGLHLRRITHVIPSVGKKPKRSLVELQSVPCGVEERELCIEKETRHSYTEEYMSLTQDFYLNF